MGWYMKKPFKVFFLFSCITVLFFFISLWKNQENTRLFGIKEITVQEKNKLVGSRKKAEEASFGSLYFNKKEIVRDNQNHYYLPLSAEEEWEKGRITTDKEENCICIMKEKKRKKKQEYQTGKEALQLLIYNDTYYEEAVLFITALPVLSIEFAQCPKELALEEEEVYAKLCFYAPKKEQKRKVQAIHSYSLVHKRGGSSREFEKCGLKLKLLDEKGKQKKENLCGLRKDDDWILIPMYTEESKLRDKFAIDLWREMSGSEQEENRGTQMEYVELVLNGVYYGLYGLAVPIDKKQLKLKEDGEETDLLFRIDTTAGFDLSALEQAGEKINAGNITVKFPKKMNQEKWNVIKEFLWLVYFESDRVFSENIGAWVEMDNMADSYLFLNVIYGKDNQLKNMYYCMRLGEDGAYKVSLIPWDMDISFGVLYDEGNENGLYWKYETKENLETEECACFLTKRLRQLNTEDFEEVLRKRYRELRQDILKEEKLFLQIESLSEQITRSGAFYRDLRAWQEGGHSTDYSIMREAIRRRLAYLNDLEG